MNDIEAKARLRNRIRALADQIDRGADLFLGTTLASLLKTTGKPLHELTLDELEATHSDLLRRRDRLGRSGDDSD
ncbi:MULTISPECIES: hypothetical protein [Mycobacterium]|uniref:hypothetical protein n=1 Tax=Mycobacterium TaxID=1763 RepID=UPI0002AC64C3|nr:MULTISPECIES: hypothetical protein [Mycobacterium]ELR86091.1 hypothetical protein W7U_12755 [Mycobacterium sp. H4Y]